MLYAISGELRLAVLAAPRRGREIVASDDGPGIPDLDRVLRGEYRSRTRMGMGLKGAARRMDTLDVTTSSMGTTVVARKLVA